MKILYISGDEYSAMSVEQEIGIPKAIELATSNNGKYTYESDETFAELKILEFGEVDSEFVEFIVDNFIDYDRAKDTNFYLIEQ
jgi:hypothetical protein